ncbi:MAG: aldehyde dehydrogenase family protein [Actinobacteria bacterium]|nr:aldehyde dehydrogenase family protein [Actinomycetota bacterium]
MAETTVPTVGAVEIPEAASPVPDMDVAELDRAVADVAARSSAWLQMTIRDKITLLQQTWRDTAATVEDWAAAAGPPKGFEPGSADVGEDLATGPLMLVRHLRKLEETLEDLDAHGEVRLPAAPTTRADGQVVVPVFPAGVLDRALTPGHRAWVWMQPHVTPETVRAGRLYTEGGEPGVCFVLGAGNIPSIGPSDCLTKLFNEGQVCVLKMNPVNAHMGPILERALVPLIREGVLRIVYGGVESGKHLSHHPDVDSVHMTASDKTHDAVVFGTGEDGRARIEAGERLLKKPVSSELGNITPIIVVPGVWSSSDIEYQAKYLTSMMTNNAGFNCGAGRMIVTHPRWKQRGELLDAIRACLREAPQRHAYYPGARDRWELFVSAHPEAETYGSDAPGEVPWTFIPDLDPAVSGDIMFTVEAFNGIFGEVAIDAPTDVPAWLDRAVAWCNETLWGTLVASVMAHPRSLRRPEVDAAVDRAVAGLRYGSIAVNAWAAVSYGLGTTTWGAFPGHPDTDIQSGRGLVHNTFMLEDPQKSVIRAPWKLGSKPPMSYDHQTMPSIARRLIALEAEQDWSQLPGLVLDGMRA